MVCWCLQGLPKTPVNLFLCFAFLDVSAFALEAACGNVTVNNTKKDPSK